MGPSHIVSIFTSARCRFLAARSCVVQEPWNRAIICPDGDTVHRNNPSVARSIMYNTYLSVAKEAAISAADGQRSRFGEVSDFEYKQGDEIVTEADFESESVIKSVIHDRFPEHEIISEESNPDDKPSSDCVWIVDPIDGTVNFQHGFSQFCVGIAMLDKQGVKISVIHNPVSEDMYAAVRGSGAKLNGTAIGVSDTKDIAESLIAASWSDREFSETKIFDALKGIHNSSHGFRKTGSAVLSMAMTAAGVFDGHCLLSLRKWDVAAGILLVEEAGGKVTNLAGEDDHRKILDDSIVATNGRIHERFRDSLQLH